ncbi:thiol reductase thioredoxin [Christiangramia fulva]|uniref:Thiol reductase thioredoxin n=1 Tax=Christiangramia fulva TaxID=2126553 RepID=A0A2R3Z5L2_9FLAO|nr:thioredoxin family protein [Christiangramia fulva]AVR45555.1 thiol reductase thioredoxin [Christiangramia fulva]
MNTFLILFTALVLNIGNPVQPELNNNKITNSQSDMLLGKFQKEDLMQEPYSSWFTPAYQAYEPDKKAMKTIKKNIDDYKIKLFMGTWCHDSKRETPRLLKILDEAGFNYDNIEMYAVDYRKNTPSKAEEGLNIKRVPTIIFYKNGKEVNRFVEYAQGKNIEEDIAQIVSGENYKNSYAD